MLIRIGACSHLQRAEWTVTASVRSRYHFLLGAKSSRRLTLVARFNLAGPEKGLCQSHGVANVTRGRDPSPGFSAGLDLPPSGFQEQIASFIPAKALKLFSHSLKYSFQRRRIILSRTYVSV
jgi:hypothetical protein